MKTIWKIIVASALFLVISMSACNNRPKSENNTDGLNDSLGLDTARNSQQDTTRLDSIRMDSVNEKQ